MIYQLVLKQDSHFSHDFERFHDNPRSAMETWSTLAERLGKRNIAVMRDEVEITETQLASDAKGYEIQTVIEEETHLPSTYRQGRGGDSDIGLGADGFQHGVWKPRNPDDDFN